MSGSTTGGGYLLFPDPIWKASTFDAFVAAYPPFRYHPLVPEVIRKRLNAVHKLLLHSYFEYEFIDIAYLRAVQIEEMALRLRHEELGSPPLSGSPQKRPLRSPSLHNLLVWAEQTGLLEERDTGPSWRKMEMKRIDMQRELRNLTVHASANEQAGMVKLHLLYRVMDFVNELYEDPDLRRRRHTLEDEFQQVLNRVMQHGAILTLNGKRWLVFHAEILLASQVSQAWYYDLGFLKIFPPLPDNTGSYSLPDPLILSLHDSQTVEGILHFTDQNGNAVSLGPIADKQNADKFEAFLRDFTQRDILRFAAFQSLAEQRVMVKRNRFFTAECGTPVT